MEQVVKVDGYIAVQHYSSNPYTVKINDSGTVYNFVPQHNVSLAMVREEDLAKIMTITRKACCGTNPRRFHLASQVNYNLWRSGNRYGNPPE